MPSKPLRHRPTNSSNSKLKWMRRPSGLPPHNRLQAAPSGQGDLMEQIQKLAALHSQGVLSDEEFSAAKAKLLT